MKKTLFVALLAALPVFAQPEMPKTKDIPVPAPGMEQPRHWGAAGEMPGRPSREDMQKKMLEKFDADKDGQLSDAEKEAIKAGMKGERPNFGGKRGEKGERPNFGGKRGEKGERPSREDMQKKMLEKFDADKDGQLSDAEKEAIKAGMKGERPNFGGKRGEKGERPNFDGKRPEFGGEKGERPSREDMQKKMLEKFDADKDGQISDAEKEAMKAARPQRERGQGKGKGRGNKGPRGPQRGADVPVTLPL